MPKSTRLRVILAFAGLLLITASLLALAYAFWPADTATDEYIPPPTLFAPPQSSLPPSLGAVVGWLACCGLSDGQAL